MLPLSKTFHIQSHLPAPPLAARCRMNTDATGDQSLTASPFENPIRIIWSEIDPDCTLSREELSLLRAAFFATFSEDY